MTSHTAHPDAADLVRRAVREFESALIGYAATITSDSDAARDVVQDTFLKLYLQDDIAKLDGPGLKAWLFTVCRNRALDWLRRRKRLVSLEPGTIEHFPGTQVTPVETAAGRDEGSEVLRFFRRLPRNQAECLRLKFQHELSYKEIAAATGLSVTNVGFLIHTGLKRLRQLLSHQSESPRESAHLLPVPLTI